MFSQTRVVDQSEHTGLFGRTGLHQDLTTSGFMECSLKKNRFSCFHLCDRQNFLPLLREQAFVCCDGRLDGADSRPDIQPVPTVAEVESRLLDSGRRARLFDLDD